MGWRNTHKVFLGEGGRQSWITIGQYQGTGHIRGESRRGENPTFTLQISKPRWVWLPNSWPCLWVSALQPGVYRSRWDKPWGTWLLPTSARPPPPGTPVPAWHVHLCRLPYGAPHRLPSGNTDSVRLLGTTWSLWESSVGVFGQLFINVGILKCKQCILLFRNRLVFGIWTIPFILLCHLVCKVLFSFS